MPRKRATATTAKKSAKARKVNAESKLKSVAEIRDGEIMDAENNAVENNAGIKKPAPIFTTFLSKTVLEGGLSLIRSLGGDKYELINLSTVPRDVISSKETSALIHSDPAREAAIINSGEDVESALLKLIMALRSTSKSIAKQNVCRTLG